MRKHFDITFKTGRKVRKVLTVEELNNYVADANHILDVYDVAEKTYIYRF